MSMPATHSPYPTAPLAMLIDGPNDTKSMNNNCNGAGVNHMTASTTHMDTANRLSHRKSQRKPNKMNVQVVCITVTLVICCIVITGLEVWNSLQSWKLQLEIDMLQAKLATLQTNYDDLKNTTETFIARMNTRPWQSDARWFDPNRNSSDEDYEEDFVYDEEEDEDYDNENDYTNRNGTNVNGSMIPSAKQSFDGVSDDYVDERLDERKPLPLNEDEYDATVTDEPPRNETVKRTSRSVPSGEHGIPVIDGTYVDNRKPTDDSTDAKAVRALRRLSDERRHGRGPRFHHKWSDDETTQRMRKYPKKYEPETDDVTRHRHRHRHQPKTTTSASPSGTIDVSDLFEQDMQSSHSQLNEEIIRHTNAYQPKPRRRILRPPPPQSIPVVRAVRSPSHQSSLRFKTIAVHYQGDTSAYTHGGHVLPHHMERFDGNGRVRHPGGVYADWKPAYWVNDHAMERFFSMNQGVVTVKEHGLYYIYAQIFYHDDHDTNGYIVEHNAEPLYQCTTATHSNQRVTKSNTCHTAGINYLSAGDRIHIKDLGSHRYALFDASKSFFGLIKVGDLRGGGAGHILSTAVPNYMDT